MDSPALCSEAEIRDLVGAFYGAIRQDARLGPIFAAHVSDWDAHLARMASFWSSTLLGTGSYRGTPMARHAGLPDLDGELFGRWLDLFQATTAGLANVALRERADELAGRIAQSLWYGYQLYRSPARAPEEIARRRAEHSPEQVARRRAALPGATAPTQESS